MHSASGLVRLGLTGGIGSGKSTVASMLGALGAGTIDADAISRQTTEKGGSAIARIREVFGDEYITDGALSRERMRLRIFSNPSARAQLEAIVHPLVGAEMMRQIERAKQAGFRVLVYDIPLLLESGRWRSQLDHVWVVDCTVETQIRRVVKRNGLGEEAVQQIIAAQAPRGARLAAADAVVFNDAVTIEQLHTEIGQLANTLGL